MDEGEVVIPGVDEPSVGQADVDTKASQVAPEPSASPVPAAAAITRHKRVPGNPARILSRVQEPALNSHFKQDVRRIILTIDKTEGAQMPSEALQFAAQRLSSLSQNNPGFVVGTLLTGYVILPPQHAWATQPACPAQLGCGGLS